MLLSCHILIVTKLKFSDTAVCSTSLFAVNNALLAILSTRLTEFAVGREFEN